MSESTTHEDFRDLPILGELRDELQTLFESPASTRTRRSLRRRWPHRGSRLVVVLAASVIAGGSALATGLLSGQRSRQLTATFAPGTPTRQEGYGPPGSTYSISIAPSMQTGVIGWCTALVTYRGAERFDLGTGGCNGAPPALGAPMFGASDGGLGVSGLSYVFTAPQVAAVRISGGPTILTRTDPRLPFGFRAAVFSLPNRLLRSGGPVLTALDSAGRPIPGDAFAEPVTEEASSWKAPGRPAPGACSISPRAGAHVALQSGSVLRSATGDPGIVGRAFLPCLNASFTLDGERLGAAVLLDAREPGQAPGGLPDMQPLAGHPGIFTRQPAMTNLLNGLADNTDLAARRVKGTWLVVAGGATIAQRVAALDALIVGEPDLARPAPPAVRPVDARCWIAYRPAGGIRALSQSAATTPPPLLALLGQPGRWHTHGPFRELSEGNRRYILPRAERPFLANPACATATFLLDHWTLQASLRIAVGRGLPVDLSGATPNPRDPRILRSPAADGGHGGVWMRAGGAWLHITGATALQQEALLAQLIVSAPRAPSPGLSGP
jgi:hypothetical protein